MSEETSLQENKNEDEVADDAVEETAEDTVKPEVILDDESKKQPAEFVESTNEPTARSSPSPEPKHVHAFAEKQGSPRESPPHVASPQRSNSQSPLLLETPGQKTQEVKDGETKQVADVAIQYEPYFERVESSRNTLEGDSAAQTLISRPPKKLQPKKEKKAKQSASEERQRWSVQRHSKTERPPTPESIGSRASKKHHSGRRLWGRYRPVSNDERLAYKYAELKSLLTEDFVVNADDLIDRQVEETKQVLQNYVSMRRVLGDTSLDDVNARGIDSANNRLRDSRERASRRRRGLWRGRRNEESQYNAAATVDLGPLPSHKHPLESISFPSPDAKLRNRHSSSDRSPRSSHAEHFPKPESEEVTIETDGDGEPEHEPKQKPKLEAEAEKELEPDIRMAHERVGSSTAAKRSSPKSTSGSAARDREAEEEQTAEQQYSARVAVPFGLEPPENVRERPHSDNQLGNSNNPTILKWLTYKNSVIRRQQLEDIRRRKREKELERSKKEEEDAHKLVAEEAFKRWLAIKEEERLLASRGRTSRAQLGHQENSKRDGEGEENDGDEEGERPDGEKDPEEAELEQTAQGRMPGSMRPRGNYFFKRTAPWRAKSASSFSSDGPRVRMKLVGRQSVLSSRPATALTGRASEVAESASAGPTVAEGELLGEGVSADGERALEEKRERAVSVQVTSSEALRRKRHSYQEWLAKKRAELVERKKREEAAKRALAPNFDSDLMGIVPEIARKRIQERRDQKRRVDTNLRPPQSEAGEQQVRPGLGYPSPPPNIHYRSNEPPIPGTRQKLWDQRMAVVAAYSRPITLPSELPAEAGGELPKQTAALESSKQPLALEAPQPKTPKQTSIDRRVDQINERHENPYSQAKQVFDWMPPPAGSARAESQVPLGGRPEGIERLNLQADESSLSPKSGPSSLSASAKSKSPAHVSPPHAAALLQSALSPKADSAHSSHQQPLAGTAASSGLVPHPPATSPPAARDSRSTPRRSRPSGTATSTATATATASHSGDAASGVGPEAELALALKKPSDALKSRPGEWIDALSEFVVAKKENEPQADTAAAAAAVSEAGSPAAPIATQEPLLAAPDGKERQLGRQESSSSPRLSGLDRPEEQPPSARSPEREAQEEAETGELRPGTFEEAASSAAVTTLEMNETANVRAVAETESNSPASSNDKSGDQSTPTVSSPEPPALQSLERNENPSLPTAEDGPHDGEGSESTEVKPAADSAPQISKDGEDEAAAEIVEDAPEIEATSQSEDDDFGNKMLFD